MASNSPSIHNILCGLIRHLQNSGKPGIDFFIDTEFTISKALESGFRNKKITGTGSGFQEKASRGINF